MLPNSIAERVYDNTMNVSERELKLGVSNDAVADRRGWSICYGHLHASYISTEFGM